MKILYAAPVFEQEIKKIKSQWQQLDSKIRQSFSITLVQFGFDKSSRQYGKSISKLCEHVGIHTQHIVLPDDISLSLAKKEIHHLNQDNLIRGILILQPVSDRLKSILYEIDYKKDIEAMTAKNLGYLMLDQHASSPCTPMAVMKLIRFYNIAIDGEDVCVVGKSNIVGLPLSILLAQAGATVTLCHSKTRNIKEKTRQASLVIIAIGRPNFVDVSWFSPSCSVIDVGTNYTANGLIGDVNFESVKEKISQISPVPGGIGKLTPLILLENCIRSCH